MKFFIFALTAIFGAIGMFNSKKYDHLDLSSDEYDITWDEITDDLWP